MNRSNQLPEQIKYCIVGAGIHGLSTALHLAHKVKQAGGAPSHEIVVLDKSGVAAGASGIACGVVRNNYFQPAMSDLMIDSITIWEKYAEQLYYHSVGYLAVAGPHQTKDLREIAERHEEARFPHRFIEGRDECSVYMRRLFPDWKESDATGILHEQLGGFAYSSEAIHGLAKLVEAEGVAILSDVEVQGFDFEQDQETVQAVRTSTGVIRPEMMVIAVGPWIGNCWKMLQLSEKIDVRDSSGNLYPNRDMWCYWKLQEGETETNVRDFLLTDGSTPPVMHIDSEDPLVDEKGKQMSEGPWGIYFKRDHGHVQGGAVPIEIGREAQVDPYGKESPFYTVDSNFIDYWTTGLARSLKRFEGCRERYKEVPSGGIGCFSADNFPVFDFMRPNVYVIADSNHGFKMISVGKEVAAILTGEESRILQPFRFSRFVEGDLHPVSSSPFPWS